LVGFGKRVGSGLLCRPSMNDPPTALVGFGDEEFPRAKIHATAIVSDVADEGRVSPSTRRR
jgi:hypothetical protein